MEVVVVVVVVVEEEEQGGGEEDELVEGGCHTPSSTSPTLRMPWPTSEHSSLYIPASIQMLSDCRYE